MSKWILFVPFALGACQTAPRGIEVRTVEVPVTRVESCVGREDIPKRPADLPKRPANVSAALDIAVARLLEWTGYGEKADALLQGCARVEQPH